jgi:hypothetical protein
MESEGRLLREAIARGYCERLLREDCLERTVLYRDLSFWLHECHAGCRLPIIV